MAGSFCCGLRDILRGRIMLLLIAFGFLPIYSLIEDDSSSLIEKKCGSLEFQDEDFGTYELTAANCGREVQLDQVNGREAPAVTFKNAVNLSLSILTQCNICAV